MNLLNQHAPEPPPGRLIRCRLFGLYSDNQDENSRCLT